MREEPICRRSKNLYNNNNNNIVGDHRRTGIRGDFFFRSRNSHGARQKSVGISIRGMKIRRTISRMSSGNSTLSDLSRLGAGYGIAIALGILVLIITITLASYVCVRVYSQSQPSAAAFGAGHAAVGDGAGPRRGDESSTGATSSVSGLDQATLDTYPKILYSKSRRGGGNACCSICLSDYKEAEALRVLPDCGHMFHVTCIDAWLRRHATCPMCRTSPLPSPLSTPLSEVVPLAVLSQR